MFFVIGFIGRVGSSYLQGLLNSHPEVGCLGEILSWKGAQEGEQSCREHLDRLVHNHATLASGFKLALAHIQANQNIVDILHEHEYRVVHLTRGNRVDQYISMRLAQINNIWRSDRGAYSVHSFEADPQQLHASVNAFLENDRILTEHLHGLPLMTITYEDLVAGTWRSETLEFLGVPPRDMQSPFVRQRRATRQRDALENYDELSSYFRGTELENFFVE